MDSERSDLHEVVAAHEALLDGARPEAVKKQHDRGKLTARERVDLLLDPDGRIEYGPLATPEGGGGVALVSAESKARAKELPLEGPLAFTGRIDGRPVAVLADDFTMLGGTAHALGGQKMIRMADLALRRGIPLIFMLDGGGHRIHDMDTRMFAAGGAHGPFRHTAMLSGWVPQVAAVMGPAFAGPAMATCMADYVPIVKGTGHLGMAGTKLVKAGTGEDVTNDELAGSTVHTQVGGADEEVESDVVCIGRMREFLSFFPSNAEQALPERATEDPASRLCTDLRDIVPVERRRAYDIRRVIRSLCDDGLTFEHRAAFAKNIVTSLGWLGGRPVGFIANQPMQLAGMLDAAACDKAARFVWLCNAFGIPLVSLIDTPGFTVGTRAERENTVRHMGRMLMALGHVSVPLVSIVVRKGYGGGYVGMAGGRSYETDAAWVWPTAEISAMGVEGSVDIAFHRDYENAPDPQARRQEMIDEFYQQITPIRAASGFGIDDAIDPAETRMRLISVFSSRQAHLRKSLPPKRHHIDPL